MAGSRRLTKTGQETRFTLFSASQARCRAETFPHHHAHKACQHISLSAPVIVLNNPIWPRERGQVLDESWHLFPLPHRR